MDCIIYMVPIAYNEMEFILHLIDQALANGHLQDLDMINAFIDQMLTRLERGVRDGQI